MSTVIKAVISPINKFIKIFKFYPHYTKVKRLNILRLNGKKTVLSRYKSIMFINLNYNRNVEKQDPKNSFSFILRM